MTTLEQQATITQVSGSVQLIRDGFFLPAQVGMLLLPGDRVVSDPAGKAIIQFTGVKDVLVIEQGAAATFNLEVVEIDKAPQWIATDLYGEGVYFEGQTKDNVASTESESPSLFGLFGTSNSTAESTGYPLLESVLFLGATAAIYSDNEDNNTAGTATDTSESDNDNDGGTTNPPPPVTPPEPEPEPSPSGPLDVVLTPIGSLVGDLLGASSGLGSVAPSQNLS